MGDSEAVGCGAPVGRALDLVASVCIFVWATLGRMGWKGQTIKGDTIMERADELIFRSLYWVGTFLGVLAVWGSVLVPISSAGAPLLPSLLASMWAADWIRVASVLKDFTLAGAAIVTTSVAVRGLRTWSRQLKGTTEYQVAHKVLRSIALVQDRISDCRQPVTLGEEWVSRPRAEGGELGSDQPTVEDLAHAYFERIRPVNTAVITELHAAELDAVALWGDEARERLFPLAKQANKLYHAARIYFPMLAQRPRGMRPRADDDLELFRRDLYSRSEGDQYAEELSKIVKAAEDFFRKYLK